MPPVLELFIKNKYVNTDFIHAALRNHMRIVFEEMSSWTPLTMDLGMKTTFWTKYIKRKYVRIFITMIFDFHKIIRKCILTLYELFLAESCISLNMHFLQSL